MKHSMSDLISTYIYGFNQISIDLVSISYFHFDFHLLIWAVVHNYDRESKEKLFLVENIINSKYAESGFRLTTIIMEENDKILAPSEFKYFKDLSFQNQYLKNSDLLN